MGSRRGIVAVGVALLAAVAGVVVPATQPARAADVSPRSADVHVFYYPWYGSPAVLGSFRHWQQGGHTPPNDVGANFYPVLGAYDSGDVAGAVRQHMAWVRQSGAGVIIYSWWGQGSYEDQLAAGVLAAANEFGIRVAWHLEPYAGRTAASTASDITYINSRYGGSPAFYRDARHGNRPAFYVFESLRIADWTPLEQVRANNIVLAQTTDTTRVAHFGGMYTYDAIAGATAPGWKQAGDFCKANGLVWAPSVGPGYVDDRAVPGNTTPTLNRDNGATYDREWGNALNVSTGGPPDWVSITSFNEWHEGSIIEPASSSPPAGIGYQTFVGAYGTTGAAAQTAYLDRTLHWVNQFAGGTPPPPPNPNLAAGRTMAASSWTQGFVPSNANDGNANSYWESANNAFPQWLQVDLGAATTIRRLVLRLPPQPAWATRTQTLSVQGSTNGSSFTTIVASAGYPFNPGTGNTVTITLPVTNTRFVRLNVTANTGWPAGQSSELEVYAT